MNRRFLSVTVFAPSAPAGSNRGNLFARASRWLACFCSTGPSRVRREESYRLRRNISREFRAQARPQPSEDTPTCPTSPRELGKGGRDLRAPNGGRTSGRVFGRLTSASSVEPRSGVKPEIPFTSRRLKAGTQSFAGTRNGSPERQQAGQRALRAEGVRLFESTGAFGAKTVTDKNPVFQC
jgi:hypothetical protein